MDRRAIYDRWMATTYKNQYGQDAPLCDRTTILQFDKVIDSNFLYYTRYQDYYIECNGAASIPTRRAEIVKFLLSDNVIRTPLENISKQALDEYISSRKENAKKSTFLNRISYLSGFFDFLQSTGVIKDIFNFEQYRKWAEDCPDSDKNKPKALTPKQISEFRKNLLIEAETQHKYREYLYIFDMKYYTDFEDNQIKRLSLASNVDTTSCTIKFGTTEAQVPQAVIDNIIQLNEAGRLGNLLNVQQYILYMKPLLEEFNFENLRKKDIKETRKNLTFTCPQCGKKLEAIIDNWCAVEYCDGGKMWIVCRECGANV